MTPNEQRVLTELRTAWYDSANLTYLAARPVEIGTALEPGMGVTGSDWASRHLRRLVKRGLVECVSKGLYRAV